MRCHYNMPWRHLIREACFQDVLLNGPLNSYGLSRTQVACPELRWPVQNSGGLSRSVECETRWPEGQIRWPRAPVLTARLFNVNEQLTLQTLHQVVSDLASHRSSQQSLFNVNELLTFQTLHQVVGDLAGLRSAEQRLRVFVVVFKCFRTVTYNLVVLFLQVISFTSSLVISSVQGNLWLNTKGV